jgi:L-ascorbate metabolism protein UlaG (beta-lactamase superfamily)
MTSSVARTVPTGNEFSVQRLAWAGIKLEANGVAVLIDATAPDPASGVAGPPLASNAARCFALVTHHHGDHCDPVALKPVLGQNGYIVAQEDVSRLFDHRGVTVQSVGLYQPVFLSRGRGEFVA